jgi:hypothetical protein
VAPPTPVVVEALETSNSDITDHPPSIGNSATLKVEAPYNEYSVTTLPPGQPLQPRPVLSARSPLSSTSHPCPETSMNPTIIVSILGAVLSCVQALFDAIAKAQQADAAEKEALKELRRTVLEVEDDIKFFKTMVSVLGSTENESNLLFLQRFVISSCLLNVVIWDVPLTPYYRGDAKRASEKFHGDLCAMISLLGTESPTESFTLPTHSSLKLLLRSLIYLPLTGQRTVVSDLKEARINILDNQQNMKRDFRLLWNLYTIFQQRATTQAIFSLDQSGVKSMTGALDAVSWVFIDHPFGISRPCGSFSLSVLNRDHDAASRTEGHARQLGKGWIDNRVNRHHVPADQLIDVQTALFELIWSGTIHQLKENPTRNTIGHEHRKFEQILDQLDRSLQEVIARSKRPRFTISFYGMARAGKSLLLNSLVGKIVLPLNGRYRWNSIAW